jgi:hypothetical protein
MILYFKKGAIHNYCSLVWYRFQQKEGEPVRKARSMFGEGSSDRFAPSPFFNTPYIPKYKHVKWVMEVGTA